MNKIVNKKIAIWLKSIGFHEKVQHFYWEDKELKDVDMWGDSEDYDFNVPVQHLTDEKISAPTVTHALYFLIKNKGVMYETYNSHKTYNYILYENGQRNEYGTFKTPEGRDNSLLKSICEMANPETK